MTTEPTQSYLKHKKNAESLPPLRFSVISVSDSRDAKSDRNGSFLRQRILSEGHELLALQLVKDEPLEIEAALNDQVEKGAQVVILNGGTGISKRDGTYETVRQLFCTEIPGFGEIFRHLSYQQIGAAAMLSRAAAGIYKNVLVFLTPGSPKAVQLAWKELISKEIRHMVWEINR